MVSCLLAAMAQRSAALVFGGDLQGVMLLGAILPQHGPGPSPQAEEKMNNAGSLLYESHQLMQTAADRFQEVKERIRAGSHPQAAAHNLGEGERFLQRGESLLQKGQTLQREAEALFQNASSSA